MGSEMCIRDRIPGNVMGVLQYFQKFRVRVWKCCRTHRSSGYCGMGVQNSQKFRASTKNAVPVPRVLWHEAYRTHRTSGYGYDPTELTEVPGTSMKVLQNFQKLRVCGTGVQNLQKFGGRVWKCQRTHRSSRYCGTGVQNSHKFRAGTQNAVPVPRVLWHGAYRTCSSSGQV